MRLHKALKGKTKGAAVLGLAAAFLTGGMASALADPPPWAPAHGYYKKKHHGKKHKGKHEREYERENVYVAPVPTFGIDTGRCNRELLGSVLGAAAGGLAGSNVGKGDGRLVAIAGGTIIGYLIGGSIGRTMDQVDQNCIGQILERASDRQDIIWNNPQNGAVYQVTPERTWQQSSGEYCREYTAQSQVNGKTQTTYGTACRQVDGSWKIKN